MICLNCGQQLPVGAKVCLNCRTPQGAVSPTGTTNVSGTNTDSLLQRVDNMLADGDFVGAMSKCDTILDSDPTNGKVYFYMLMSSFECKNRTELANLSIPFDDNQYYIKAVQYGDASLKDELAGYINTIIARNDAKRKREEEYLAKLNDLKVGDTFFYGSHNGHRISWKVLKVQDRKALVITTKNICDMPYHQIFGDITWSECTLRKWLNEDFIKGDFTQAERARILPCKLNNDNNLEYKTPGGASTTDEVFLLSINEAKTIFADDQERSNSSRWWLRSPGGKPNFAAYVDHDGEVRTEGHFVFIDLLGGVRPAIWLDINSLNVKSVPSE